MVGNPRKRRVRIAPVATGTIVAGTILLGWYAHIKTMIEASRDAMSLTEAIGKMWGEASWIGIGLFLLGAVGIAVGLLDFWWPWFNRWRQRAYSALISSDQKGFILQATGTIRDVPVQEMLNKFFAEQVAFIDRDVDQMNADHVTGYIADANNMIGRHAKFIKANLGSAAEAKFLDKSSMVAVIYAKASSNARLNQCLMSLDRHKKNLEEIMKLKIWDEAK